MPPLSDDSRAELHTSLTVGRVQGGGQILLISAVKRKAAVSDLGWGTERQKWGRRHRTHGGRFHKTLK